MCKIIYIYPHNTFFIHVQKFLLSKLKKHPIPWFVHPNSNWNWVLPCDSNNKFHAQPNNRIQIVAHFLSILDFEFSVQFNSKQIFLHPNTTLMVNHTLGICGTNRKTTYFRIMYTKCLTYECMQDIRVITTKYKLFQ